MPAISPTNTTRLRYAYQRIKPNSVKLNVFRWVVKATADINQAVFDYPLAELTVDNTSADWAEVREGELFEIVDGSGNVVYTDIHRKNPTSDTIFFSRIQSGTNQRGVFTAVTIGNNYQVRSSYTQSIGSFASLVDEVASVTTIYKRVDIELDLDDPQPQYPKPQPNIGTWQQADAASDGTAQFDIDASASFSLIGGTLSYLQEPPDDMSIVTGTDTDAAVTVEADVPGQYVYSVRVEDDAIPPTSPQQQKRGFRYLFVNDPDDYPAFNQEYAVEILKDEEPLEGGRSITFRAYGNGAFDELYTGAPVLLTYDIQVSNLGSTWIDLDDGLSRRTFVGYVTSFNLRKGRDGVEICDFTVESPLSLYTRFPIANQLLEEAVTVTNWQQTVAANMHLLFACYYIMEYHSPASLYMHDLKFDTGVDTFFSNPFPIRAGSITAAVKTLMERIFGFFTCHSDGTLWLKRNPRVEDDTYRSSVDSVWTWEAQDIDDSNKDGVEYELNDFLTVKETTGSFTYYDSGENSAATGRSNLFSPAQATGSQTLPDHISLDFDDGLARVGHMHQYANRPVTEITLKAGAGFVGEFVSPADCEWYTMDFNSFDIGGMSVFDMRHLATKVIRQWTIDKQRGITLRHQLVFEPETKGLPAQEVEYDPPTGGTIPITNDWQYTFNFLTSDGDFAQFTSPERPVAFGVVDKGVWVAGQGWTTESYSSSGVKHMCEVSLALSVPAFITSIEYDFANASNASTGGGTSFALYALAFNGGTVYESARHGEGFIGTPCTLAVNAIVDTIAMALYFSLTSTNESYASRMRVYGTGVNPFI